MLVRPFASKFKVYTRTGDNGTSSLFNLDRRPKNDRHFEALGDTDELNALLGVCREHVCLAALPQLGALESTLVEVQSRLFDVGAHLATPLTSSDHKRIDRTTFNDAHVAHLEAAIDAMDEELPAITNFVLPSGGLLSAHLHVARTVARRAERRTVELVADKDVDPVVARYLNRLSDFLFVAARYAAQAQGRPEVLYKKERETRAPA